MWKYLKYVFIPLVLLMLVACETVETGSLTRDTEGNYYVDSYYKVDRPSPLCTGSCLRREHK